MELGLGATAPGTVPLLFRIWVFGAPKGEAIESAESMQPTYFAITRAQVMDFLEAEPEQVVTDVVVSADGFNQAEVRLTGLTIPKPQSPRG